MALNTLTFLTPASQTTVQEVTGEKSADQTVTNNTTLQNDSDLAVSVAANGIYYFRFFVPFAVAGNTSGFKCAITGPAAPTNLRYTRVATNLTAIALLGGDVQSTFAVSLGFAVANVGDHQLILEGWLENGGNAGTLQFQFAQNTTDAVNAVTVRRGASVVLKRIS